MPNQDKCDHTFCTAVNVHAFDIRNVDVYLCQMSDIPISQIMTITVRFNFCPEYGAKIDWEAIKEACDEKNNE